MSIESDAIDKAHQDCLVMCFNNTRNDAAYKQTWEGAEKHFADCCEACRKMRQVAERVINQKG